MIFSFTVFIVTAHVGFAFCNKMTRKGQWMSDRRRSNLCILKLLKYFGVFANIIVQSTTECLLVVKFPMF